MARGLAALLPAVLAGALLLLAPPPASALARKLLDLSPPAPLSGSCALAALDLDADYITNKQGSYSVHGTVTLYNTRSTALPVSDVSVMLQPTDSRASAVKVTAVCPDDDVPAVPEQSKYGKGTLTCTFDSPTQASPGWTSAQAHVTLGPATASGSCTTKQLPIGGMPPPAPPPPPPSNNNATNTPAQQQQQQQAPAPQQTTTVVQPVVQRVVQPVVIPQPVYINCPPNAYALNGRCFWCPSCTGYSYCPPGCPQAALQPPYCLGDQYYNQYTRVCEPCPVGCIGASCPPGCPQGVLPPFPSSNCPGGQYFNYNSQQCTQCPIGCFAGDCPPGCPADVRPPAPWDPTGSGGGSADPCGGPNPMPGCNGGGLPPVTNPVINGIGDVVGPLMPGTGVTNPLGGGGSSGSGGGGGGLGLSSSQGGDDSSP